ncbi:DUF2752 domain-containing protein [Verrucomicrobiales bacterium]|jgi:hypothetical protein|nr:DUF2752 domain-containing protein [Verrucomicrobiales bacterium]MDC0258609.1 DUF2752 domain-containing protein [Verrucomicrobiales bacterium]MDC0322739.1 DUF2752 domain-containing protein [Verrucomicrobiales bacterium]
MIRLVITSRVPKFEGVTPAWFVCVTLFFGAVIANFFINQKFGTTFTPCLFKNVTALPCFLCGGTRASLKLASGHPIQAFFQNPLVTVVLSYIAFALVLKFGFAKKLVFSGPFKDRRFLWMIAISTVGSNWIYMIRTL